MAEIESSIYDTLNKGLYKSESGALINPPDALSPSKLSSGSMYSDFNMVGGNIRAGKVDFTNDDTGFILGLDNGISKFYIGDSTNYFNWDGTNLTISGSFTAGSGTIGGFEIGSDYLRDAGNSFGLASTVTGGDDVRFWAGASYANRATAPFRITEAGAATASSITITGGSITGAGIVSISALNIANRGWTQTSTFSVVDSDTVEWQAGTFTTADGTAYSISAGDTGNMSAKTYIYLDIGVSTTAYQTTTTATTAIGTGKVLVAVAENNTAEATFQVLSGQGAKKLDASEIVANSITANEISTSLLYAGSIEIDTLGNIRSGQTAYNTGTGWWIGNDAGTPKLSIGSSTSIVYSTIAFDAVSNGGEDSSVSSSTHSHTCTGSDLVLLIEIAVQDTVLADRTVSSVTYNGVACTKLRSDDNNDQRRTEIWALFGPDTGAHNIVVTMGGTCTRLTVCGLSLTNAETITTSNGVSLSGSTTSASASLTSVVDNSWIVGVLATTAASSGYSEGASQTNRFTSAGVGQDVQVSTKIVTPAGASTMSWTWSTAAFRSMTAVVVQPKATVSSSGNSMTWDGNELMIRGITSDVQTFTGSGTWTKPNSGAVALIRCWGGGGSGAKGKASHPGGGGGGGGYAEVIIPLSSLGSTETVTIGAGGAAVSAADTSGNNGGNTTFGSWLTAYGGGGGNHATSGGNGGGGGGGGGSNAKGDTPSAGDNSDGSNGGGILGGAGATSTGANGGDSTFGGAGGGEGTAGPGIAGAGGNSIFGGGGGGAGGTNNGSQNTTGLGGNSTNGGGGGGGGSAATGAPAGGTSKSGGNGGAGAFDANTATSGVQPAGGGGGSETGTSGAGGDGKCTVTVF